MKTRLYYILRIQDLTIFKQLFDIKTTNLNNDIIN